MGPLLLLTFIDDLPPVVKFSRLIYTDLKTWRIIGGPDIRKQLQEDLDALDLRSEKWVANELRKMRACTAEPLKDMRHTATRFEVLC